jgi:uncharacterized protein YecT (DUF1311 family)
MISFSNARCFLGTIIFVSLSAGFSVSQLSQGILSRSLAKPAPPHFLSTESAQATLVTAIPGRNCLNSKTQTNNCPQLDNLKSTKRLEEVYQQVVSGLGGASREKLINSQLAWVSFAEAQCGFETRGFDDGASSSSVHSRCLDAMTQQRIQDLQRYLISSQ